MSEAPDRGFTVRGLGEIAIRCRDVAAMHDFYGGVLGLEVLAHRPRGITFFKLGAGYGGHTTVLALFYTAEETTVGDAGVVPANSAPPSSLHHLALTVGWDEQAAAMTHYEHLGLDYRVEEFEWIGWRGVFVRDPDGNTVELVAADPAHAPGH